MTPPNRPQAEPRWSLVGPGLVVAATGVGAADLIATTVAGSKYGYALLWAVVAGCIMKIVLVEGAAATAWPPATPSSRDGARLANGPAGISAPTS